MSSPQHLPLDGSDLAKIYGITLTPVADTDVCVILLGSDDILYFRYRPNAKETLEDLERYSQQMSDHLGATGKKYGMLADLNDMSAITKEARAAHADPDKMKLFSSMALVVRSSLARASGGFFIVLNAPPVTTKLFATLDEARQWLLKRKQGLDDADDAE